MVQQQPLSLVHRMQALKFSVIPCNSSRVNMVLISLSPPAYLPIHLSHLDQIRPCFLQTLRSLAVILVRVPYTPTNLQPRSFFHRPLRQLWSARARLHRPPSLHPVEEAVHKPINLCFMLLGAVKLVSPV